MVVLFLATHGRRVAAPVAFVFSQAAMAAAVWYVLCARKNRPLATLGVGAPMCSAATSSAWWRAG